jgi:hypothetical protein
MPAKSKYSLGSKEILLDLKVPSGQMCQVRRPGPMGLIQAGVLDSIDVLGSVVQTQHVDRVAGRPVKDISQDSQVMDLLRDKGKLNAANELINKVVCYVVVQPKLHMPSDEMIADEAVSVENVDFMDRVFIMQFVMGGTQDLATFRSQFGTTLGSVESLAESAGSAE